MEKCLYNSSSELCKKGNSKSYQLRNVNPARLGSRSITTQLGKLMIGKSEVIALVDNACMNVFANDFYSYILIQTQEISFSEVFALFSLKLVHTPLNVLLHGF